MRAPRRRHPRKDERLVPAANTDLESMATRVTYVISAEHKDYLTPAGPGKLRSDASACPRGLDFAEVEGWLKAAVARGDVSASMDDEYPRYVWARLDGRAYEARLSNAGLGQYKGYPIRDFEAPGWLG